MINLLLNTKYTIHWVIFHTLLGLISTVTIFPLVGWFYVVLVSGLYEYRKTTTDQKNLLLLFLAKYLGTLELLGRMAKTSPLIPYEISKYLFFCLFLLGIINLKNIKSIGWGMILLLLPSVFFDKSHEAFGYQSIVFNLLGPINVALAIIFCSKLMLNEIAYIKLFKMLIYALLPSLIYTIIKTPDFETIEFALTANFNTSGGFGSNQVSSAFGLGMFIMFISWIRNWKLTSFAWLDIIFLLLFSFQGIMTFSRGGILGAVISILVFLLLSIRYAEVKQKTKLMRVLGYSFVGGIALYFAFNIADNITNGMLSLRYQGETAGTFGGTKEQTLNNMTSNRFDIFMGDVELWQDNTILGVGIGASRYMRTKVEGVIAHVELSRLLAEHGILGLIYFILLIYVGIGLFKKVRSEFSVYYLINISLFILAIFTTFHASMRTFITPLLIGISCVGLYSPKVKQSYIRS